MQCKTGGVDHSRPAFSTWAPCASTYFTSSSRRASSVESAAAASHGSLAYSGPVYVNHVVLPAVGTASWGTICPVSAHAELPTTRRLERRPNAPKNLLKIIQSSECAKGTQR